MSLPGLPRVEEEPKPPPFDSAEMLAEHREAIRRIRAGSTFQRSPRVSQLLEYLADCTLRNDVESLKESSIGHRVFGRPADYNAAEDNIARSNIRQLRLKLAEYDRTEGVNEPWRVIIPKGSYGVTFERRESVPMPVIKRLPQRRIVRLMSGIILLVCFAAVFGYYALPMRFRPAGKGVPESCALKLLSPSAGQRLLVIVPDSDVQLYQRLTGHTVSLQDYVNRNFLRPETLRRVSPQYADSANALFHSATTQSFVLDLIPRFAEVIPPAELSVRHPSSLAMKDFEKDNALLIAGPFGDPWVQLFDRDLNFQIETEPDGQRAFIRNRAPRSSERTEYFNYADPSAQAVICYSRIAYLPGLTPAGRVLLAGGPHSASTEAACRFLTRSDSLRAICRLFQVDSPAQLPWFELLIEAKAIGDAPWSMSIIAHRTVLAVSH